MRSYWPKGGFMPNYITANSLKRPSKQKRKSAAGFYQLRFLIFIFDCCRHFLAYFFHQPFCNKRLANNDKKWRNPLENVARPPLVAWLSLNHEFYVALRFPAHTKSLFLCQTIPHIQSSFKPWTRQTENRIERTCVNKQKDSKSRCRLESARLRMNLLCQNSLGLIKALIIRLIFKFLFFCYDSPHSVLHSR